jgi:hypothetical protein
MVTAVNPISPRLLHVVIQAGPISLHVISAHAPIENADARSKESFWAALLCLASSIGPDSANLVLIGIDANARVGEIQCPGIGGEQPEKENDNGGRLREFVHEAGLIAVNSFYSAGTTWTSSYGTTARIDYVLCSGKLYERAASCRTCPEIDLATAIRDDHTSLLAAFENVGELFWDMAAQAGKSDELTRVRQQRARKYTAQSLKDPDCLWYFQSMLAAGWTRSHARRRHLEYTSAVPEEAPATDETEADVKLLVSSVREAADNCFDAQPIAQHKPWITQRTWEVICFGNQLRSMRRMVLRSRRVHLLGFAFRIWLAALGTINDSRHVVICSVASACNLYNSVCSKSDLRLAVLECNLWKACRLRT